MYIPHHLRYRHCKRITVRQTCFALLNDIFPPAKLLRHESHGYTLGRKTDFSLIRCIRNLRIAYDKEGTFDRLP